jgi:oligopeptide transport system substrate-binding protein
VHVELKGVTLAQLTPTMLTGKYELFLASWVADFFGPATFFDMWRPDSGFNLTGWKSAKYEDLVSQAESTSNALKRVDLYTAAQDLLMKSEAVMAPLSHQKISVLVGARVGAFELFPTLPYFYFKHTTLK